MNTRIKLITRRGAPWFVRSTKPQQKSTTGDTSSSSASSATSSTSAPFQSGSFLSTSDPELAALEALLAETKPVTTGRLRPRNPAATSFVTLSSSTAAAAGRSFLASRLRTISGTANKNASMESASSNGSLAAVQKKV
ncbi:MAG: hypothetical protein ACAI35_11540 [Candidatus Methylacidiphilales bacterium]|nr:hypothetical protein [Candidatus Methylacidiphilales bacterium]